MKTMGRPRNQQKPVPLALDQYQEKLQELRNLWEFAALNQFVSFFRPFMKLGVPESEVTTDVLEEDLMKINTPTLLLDKLKKALISGSLEPRFQDNDFDRDICTIYTKRIRKFVRVDSIKKESNDETPDVAEEEVLEVPKILYSIPEFRLILDRNLYNPRTGKVEGFCFDDLELADQIRVLHQLTQYFTYTDQFRDKIEALARNNGQFSDDYRIAPIGWKGEMGSYYLFDDNRLYYKQDFAPVTDDAIVEQVSAPSKKRKRKAYTGRRKRRSSRKIVTNEDDTSDAEFTGNEKKVPLSEALAREYEPEWSCLCWDLDSWQAFVKKIEKSKNPDESRLAKYLKKEVLPIIAEAEVVRLTAAGHREKNREKQQMVAHRKRSSRLEEKTMMRQEQEEEKLREEKIRQEEEDRKRKAVENEKTRALKEKKFMDRRSKQHQSLMATLRFQWQREFAQHQQKLDQQARISQGNASVPAITEQQLSYLADELGDADSESSTRQGSMEPIRKSGRERKQRTIDYDYDEEPVHQARTRQKALEDENMEEMWYFDCYGGCGVKGINYDDGNPSICCERCNTWMHVGCLRDEERSKIEDSDKEEFLCFRCREEEADIRRKVADRYLRNRKDTTSGTQSPAAAQRSSTPVAHAAVKLETGALPVNQEMPATNSIASAAARDRPPSMEYVINGNPAPATASGSSGDMIIGKIQPSTPGVTDQEGPFHLSDQQAAPQPSRPSHLNSSSSEPLPLNESQNVASMPPPAANIEG